MARKGGKRSKKGVAPASTVAPDAPAAPAAPAAADSAEKVRGRPFKSGAEWNGNAKGRPKGARSKLSEDFISKLAKDFAEHGAKAIESVRKDEPAQYLRVVSSLVPKAFDLGDDDEDGNRIAGVALITRNAIEAIIERGRGGG